MHTNHDIFMMLKEQTVNEVVCALINEYIILFPPQL